MKIKDITDALEAFAPLGLQEEWDNAGYQVGNPDAEATGALLCTDVTETVLAEAKERGFNLVVSHHPLMFHGVKKLLGRTPVERCIAFALRNDITVYSAHTNMDNARDGVSFRMAQKLNMTDVDFLDPHTLGNGVTGGCGVIGNISPTPAADFLRQVKQAFEVGAVRAAGDLSHVTISRVALCGGAGAFLIGKAMAAGAQAYISADMRYHDFLENADRLIIADIGHYESEHYTKEIFLELIQKKYPNFATAFAKRETNQINYL